MRNTLRGTTIVKKTVQALLVGTTLVVILAGSLFALAQTETGRRWAAKLLARVISTGSGMSGEVGRLEGTIPFHIRLDRLSLADQSGPWLTVDDLVIHWSPTALLGGRLHVGEITAGLIRLDRLPDTGTRAKPSRREPPSLPRELSRVRVDHLAVDRLILGEALLGERALFTLEARLAGSARGEGSRFSFTMERVEGTALKVAAAAVLAEGPRTLSVHLRAEEAPGGLLATLLGLKGPLTVAFHGEGPLEGWKGELTAGLSGLGTVQAVVGLKAGEEPGLQARGKVTLAARLVPGVVAPWFSPVSRFTVSAHLHRDDSPVLDEIALESEKISFHLSGSMDSTWKKCLGRFTLACTDLSPLGKLTGSRLGGALRTEGKVAGPLRRPEMTLKIALSGVEGAGCRLESLEGDFVVAFLDLLYPSFPGVRLEGRGLGRRLAIRGDNLFPGGEFTWEVGVEGPAAETIRLNRLKVAAKGVSLSASGRLNTSGQRAELETVVEVDDLRRFSQLTGIGLPLAGRLQARVEGDLRFPTARCLGTVRWLTKEPAAVPALIGTGARYSGTIRLTEAGSLMVSNLRVDAGGARLDGALSFNNKEGLLEGSWRVAVPNLGVLSQELGGAVEAEGRVTGRVPEFRATAKAVGQKLRLAGLELPGFQATLTGEDLPRRPHGRLTLEVDREGRRITGDTLFALAGERLRLSRLSVEGGANRLAGDLTLHTDRGLVEGSLQGNLPHVGDLSRLVGEEFTGSAAVSATFDALRMGQQVTVKVTATDLKGSFGAAATVKAEGRVARAFSEPEGKLRLEIEGGRSGKVTVGTLVLSAEGDAGRLSLTGDGRGRYGEAFQIGVTAVLERGGGLTHVVVSRFQGRYGELPVTLRGPAALTITERGYDLGRAALSVGPGRLEGWGRVGEETCALSLSLEEVPLQILRFAGGLDLSGGVTGAIQLAGASQRPEGKGELRVRELTIPRLDGIPSLQLATTAELANGRLRGMATLQGRDAGSIEAEAELPLTLSLWPVRCSLPGSGELRGRLGGEVDTALLEALPALGDQRIEGSLGIRFAVTGTVSAPSVSGEAHVQRGVYENARTGTILRDLDLVLRAKAPRMMLERARGTDGSGGTVAATGWLDLLPDEGFPFRLEVKLGEATVVRDDYVTATGAGRLILSGSMKAALLRGEIAVAPAEVRIPERLPLDIPNLEIIEIGGPPRRKPAEPEKGEATTFPLTLEVDLTSPGRIFIRGRGLESEWRGALRITGPAAQPLITGNLSLVRGRFEFPGKEFTFTRGNISFDGAVPPVPKLDMEAEAKAPKLTARLHLAGPFSSPTIALSSEPPLPREEILSQLLFGRSSAAVTPLEAAQLAYAANALAGGSGPDFMGRLRRILRIDQLQVKQRETPEGKQEAAVAAGKYILDGVYLEVEKGTEATKDKASLQVEVAPNVTVGTEVGVDSQGGVSLNWRWDY
jgi:translocation and assembly module TamB